MACSWLGIDVGTTAVRAAVLDETGRVLGAASEACAYVAPSPGRAEIDAASWWRAVIAVCRRLAASTPLDRIDAVGVTGQAPTALLVDASGRPVRPALLWLDVRAGAEAGEIERALGTGRAEAIGGNRVHPYYLGPKLAWLKRHEPESLARASLVLQSHAFVVLGLTGEARCDRSTAMLCAPLFDARGGGWSDEGARACDVPTRLLPPIVPAHSLAGAVTREASLATGLRAGTPVAAAGGDFAASALGVGVVEDGQACLMLGTAGNALLPMTEPRFDPRLINSHHVGCDRWLALGGTLCGAALEWFRRAFAPGVAWEVLEREAAAVDAAALGGLACLPYFQGERTPIWDEDIRGAFYGIDLTHGRGHLYRALLDGIAIGFAHCLAVARDSGARADELIAANGAGRSALLRQALSDATGLPLTWSAADPVAGATLVGAAALGALGVGDIDLSVLGRWHGAREAVRHAPDARGRERLYESLRRRGDVYAALRRASHDNTQ